MSRLGERLRSLNIDPSKLSTGELIVMEIIVEEVSKSCDPDDMAINQELLRFIQHRQSLVDWEMKLREHYTVTGPENGSRWSYGDGIIVIVICGYAIDTNLNHCVICRDEIKKDNYYSVPRSEWPSQDYLVGVAPKQDLLMKWLDSKLFKEITIAERLAELIVVNGGTPKISQLGNVKTDNNHPYGRIGLTVAEGLDLATMHGQFLGLFVAANQDQSYPRILEQRLQEEVNKAKSMPRNRLIIGNVDDLRRI